MPHNCSNIATSSALGDGGRTRSPSDPADPACGVGHGRPLCESGWRNVWHNSQVPGQNFPEVPPMGPYSTDGPSWTTQTQQTKRPKIATRRPKRAPRRSKRYPKEPQDGPRGPRYGQAIQDGEDGLRTAQEALGTPQESSKLTPKRAPGGEHHRHPEGHNRF